MKALFFLIFLIFSLSIKAAETITWYAYDQPPAYIFNGPYKGSGFVNLSQKLLIKALPQYKHNEVQASVGRLLHDLKLKKNVCVFGLGENSERANYVTYSEPALMNRNVHLLIDKKKATQLSLTEPVNLEDLFTEHNLSTNIIDGRFYGDAIDKVLAQYPNNVLYRSTSSEQALYQMLERKRFDFLLTYPSSAIFAIKSEVISDNYQRQLSAIKNSKHSPFY